MTATPRCVRGGENVTLTWGVTEGHGEPLDWLGLYRYVDARETITCPTPRGLEIMAIMSPPDQHVRMHLCVEGSFGSLCFEARRGQAGQARRVTSAGNVTEPPPRCTEVACPSCWRWEGCDPPYGRGYTMPCAPQSTARGVEHHHRRGCRLQPASPLSRSGPWWFVRGR